MMFKISPIQDKDTHKYYAQLCGAKYREDAFAYGMCENESGKVMGLAQFDITKGSAHIFGFNEAIGSSDFEAMFILARQTLNFIDTIGVKTVYADKDTAMESFLLAVGFEKTADGYVCYTTGMFDGNCKNHQ